MNESYCGICDEYDVPVINGVCQGCGTDYFDYVARAKMTLRTVKSCKAKGWKMYPDCGWKGMSKPIDDVILELENRIKGN